MSEEKNTKTKIAFIGKFGKLHDEEYIARSFEMLGCEVIRIGSHTDFQSIKQTILSFKPDVLLYTKWEIPESIKQVKMQLPNLKTVCWLFDLYFDYHREFQVKNKVFFKSDYVFTTDGGHQKRFNELGINHHCIRQGIYAPDCVLLPFKNIQNEIVFVGSENPMYPKRNRMINNLNAKWFGRYDTNELRGMALNELYAHSRIVIGDSYPSPNYWSNRVVETLGRGGFLIHREVEGIKYAFPCLVTYSDEKDLIDKIEYYKNHEDERRLIIQRNYHWVKNNCTMEKRCAELLSWIR